MIKPLTYFTVICDGCGIDANEESEWSAWSDESTAECSAEGSYWKKENEKHYCPNCRADMGDKE